MKFITIAFLGAGLLMSGAVAAKDYPYAKLTANADQYHGMYLNPSQGSAPSITDRRDFDRSGTRGRDGLGASPFHPEGPGDVED